MSHPATFNDGKTAERHEVMCYIDGDHLIIDGGARGSIARWPLTEIRSVKSAGQGRRYRLAGYDSRLSLSKEDDGGWLDPHCPNLAKGDASKTRWPAWAAIGVLAVCSVIGVVVYLIPAFASTVVGLVPVAFEERIGRESRDQLLGIVGRLNKDGVHLCQSEQGLDILQKRADEIANLMESPFPISITVVDMPVTNALALPGGQVIILSGLIDKAANGDEVIGVLAHEIAHVVRRDPLQVTIKQTGTALLVSFLVGDIFGGGILTGVGDAIVSGGYSRDAERAADILAVTALNQLGLTARPLARFMERIGDEDPVSASIPDFLQTHPSGAERSRTIDALSQGHGRAMSIYEWTQLERICRN